MISFKQMINKLLDIIYPDNYKCYCCGKETAALNASTYMCEECYNSLPIISGKVCLKCGETLFSAAKYCIRCKNTHFSFSSAYAFASYNGTVKELIHKYKFNNKAYLSKCFASMLNTAYIFNILPHYKIDCVSYVPSDKYRVSKRGYNHIELLAQDFCKLTNLPLYKNLLIKIKKTKPQSNLNLKDRLVNLKGAFEITHKNAVKNKTILLIDDIFTTGSTCEECSSVLIKNGAYKVIVLTVAHTNLNKVKG